MREPSTIDVDEVAKFSHLSGAWWDPNGALKTLHDLNPVRVFFVQEYVTVSRLRILDVGCGGGILSEALAHLGANVTGLDVEAGALQTAREHATQSGVVIDYQCQSIESFSSECLFDAIVCMEMLEHVTNPALVIEHFARLVKPGGYVFLSTLNRTLKAYALAVVAAEYVLQLLPRQTHDYAKFIRPSELVDMLRVAGFELVALTGVAYNPWSRQASRTPSVDVNYLLCARRLQEG